MERSFAGAPQEAVAASMSHNPSLTGLTRAGLAEALRAIETPDREIRMRVAQLWHWIYFHGVREFRRHAATFPSDARKARASTTPSPGPRWWTSKSPPTARANG